LQKKTKPSTLSPAHVEKKQSAEANLEDFIKLVHPKRCLGNVHREVINWWTRGDAKNHQLLLLPRDHMKSALIAYRVAWELTKDPTLRVLFISSTSNLATKQLKFIKDIFTHDNYRIFWPEMVNKEETKREKWTEREISLDHPLRAEWSIRDPSIFTAGLTSNIVGMHCDIAVLDDVVVQGNAYTDDGREKVKDQYSLLSSIETVNAREWVVGTRYHPKDLYSDLMSMEVEQYDEYGNVVSKEPLFEDFERQVESIGDGTGEFLWPRQQSPDGKWFGFDQDTLAKKKSQYLNKIHFRAQYYNDPNDVDSSPIQRNQFQYYDPNFLSRRDGRWQLKGERLNVFASVDFAYTENLKSDYTAIVVVGVDGANNYYVLEIDRFKTDKISEYFNHILKLYEKWGFRKLKAEVTGAQSAIVKDLKESYIRPLGLSLSIEDHKPTRWHGAKEERIMAVLEPKYANRQIWHYHSGNCQTLEEELIFRNPPHDDVKDALASVIDFATAPLNLFRVKKETNERDFNFHSRWGGVV
jgi:phage terminase large subunit-like protein